MNNLTGLFDTVNEKVGDIANQVGQTPASWNSSVYSMIHSLSESVIVPIAGLILAFVMTLEFINIIIERNNLHDFEITNIYKWMFKTACSVLIVTNTWNIVMAVFDVAQNIVNDASGIMVSDTSLRFESLIPDLEAQLDARKRQPHGAKLHEVPRSARLAGVSHHYLRGNIRRTRSEHRRNGGYIIRNLDLHGIYSALVLQPVQDRQHGEVYPRCALRKQSSCYATLFWFMRLCERKHHSLPADRDSTDSC